MDKVEQKRSKAVGKDDQSRPTKLKVIITYAYTKLVQNILWNFCLRIAIAISSCAPLRSQYESHCYEHFIAWMFLNQVCGTPDFFELLLSMNVCMRVCVCPSPRLLITNEITSV